MKSVFKTSVLLLLYFSIIISLSFVNAETTPGEAVKQQIGFNPEDLPTSPQEFKDKYLSEEWSELVSKNKYLGPIHNTFLKNQAIFKILFGDPYALSLTFLIILILWIFISVKAGQLIQASGILDGITATLAGFIFSILLAQTTLLRTLAKLSLDIITSSANWWIRLIVAIFIIVMLFIVSYLVSLIRKSLKDNRATKREEKLT
ncbi:MAG: hypothetical protein AABY00_03900, partial [Nanoarchaeota archaeon]